MKKISVIIPTYNEEENVPVLCPILVNIFTEQLPQYDYEIIFIDNDSQDLTREKLKELCSLNPKVKAIFNAKNFGQMKSPYYGLIQTTGDCTILMCADLQDPPQMIVDFIREWEQGFKIVTAIKHKSQENSLMYLMRTIYYKVIKSISEAEHIEHFTGFGLYDKQFIEVLRQIRDPLPYLRGIVGELGFRRKDIYYEQQKRQFGKSNNNWYSLYDIGMLGITSYSKIALRLATFLGFIISGISFLIAVIYFVLKLTNWDTFQLGLAPMVIGIFFLGSVQLFFIGLLGEYILNINARVIKRPLVVEEDRINF